MPQVYSNIVTFNGSDMTTVTGLTILATNPYVPGKRKLTIGEIARTNKSKINSAFYNKKTVVIRVGISRATRDLLEQSIDSLMQILQGVEKDLVINQSGATRKYTSTFSDSAMRAEGGAYVEMDLFFETSDHFGYDTAATLLTQVSGFTSAQKTTQITVGGSAPWQVPLITVTLTALSGGTSKYVIIGNDNTGQAVTISRTWAAGDVIEIDAKNQTVKVNGSEVAWTDAIPEFAPGTGYLTYSDNLTTRTWSMTATYIKRYI